MAQSENSSNMNADRRMAAGPSGMGGGSGPSTPPPASGRRGGKRFIVVPILLIVIAAAGFFGYSYLQDQSLYVATDNALVTGALLQVGSMNAGQVTSVEVDMGQKVTKGQVVATIMLPSSLGTSAAGTPKMGFRGTDDQIVSVVSPIDGVVIARSSNPGDTVGVGQSLVTVIDPTNLWVQAQIEETKIGRVQIGQPVELSVDALGQKLQGRIIAVDRATSGMFSLLPQSNSTGNFNKVVQVIPVKIAVDYGQQPLVIGSSVSVKIRVVN